MKEKNGEHLFGDSGQLILLVLFSIIILIVVFFFPLLTYADECTEGNCTNGHGTMIYADGTKRVGGFKNF